MYFPPNKFKQPTDKNFLDGMFKYLFPKILMHMQLIIYKFNQQAKQHTLSNFGIFQLFKAQWYLSLLGALIVNNTELNATEHIYGFHITPEKQQILCCSALTSLSFWRMLFFLWGTNDSQVSFSWTTKG